MKLSLELDGVAIIIVLALLVGWLVWKDRQMTEPVKIDEDELPCPDFSDLPSALQNYAELLSK